MKKVTAVALVPLDEVENVFCELLCEKPDYPQIDAWADYVLETYIEKSSGPGKPYFDKILWNQYNNDKRTNNDVEGYNYKLTTVLKVHPNIWIFITKIKSEESAGTTTIIYHNQLYLSLFSPFSFLKVYSIKKSNTYWK